MYNVPSGGGGSTVTSVTPLPDWNSWNTSDTTNWAPSLDTTNTPGWLDAVSGKMKNWITGVLESAMNGLTSLFWWLRFWDLDSGWQ